MKEIVFNQKNPMKKTVEDLEIYAKFPSTDFLMLSELIDNSVSSYLEQNRSLKGAKISITIDKRDKSNFKLTIIDNSFGMSPEILENAIQFGNPGRFSKSTTLNVYGVGLKQSAFYAGQRLEVVTKTPNSNKPIATKIFLDELAKSGEGEVNFVITQQEEQIFLENEQLNSGTCITISKLRKGRYTLDRKKDELMVSLGWKYSRYIDAGLKIIFSYLTNDSESTFENVLIEKSHPMAENYMLWKNSLAEHQPDRVERLLEEVKTKMEILKLTNTDEAIHFMELLKSGKDFLWDVEFDVIDNIRIKGKVGILANKQTIKNTKHSSQSYVGYNGFTLYQMGRAIKCGPNTDKYKISTYNVISKDISDTTNHKRRWFGEFDLDPLMSGNKMDNYIELDSNKADIKWIDDVAKENFKENILKIINKYNNVLTILNDVQNKYIKVAIDNNKKNSKEEKGQIFSDVLDSFATKHTYINNVKPLPDGRAKYLVKLPKFDNKEIEVTVFIDDENVSNQYFIDYQRNSQLVDGKENVDVKINVNHPIWKPIIRNENLPTDVQISMHKLAIIQALSLWVMDYWNDGNNTEKLRPAFFDDFEKMDFSTIFSKIAYNIFKD